MICESFRPRKPGGIPNRDTSERQDQPEQRFALRDHAAQRTTSCNSAYDLAHSLSAKHEHPRRGSVTLINETQDHRVHEAPSVELSLPRMEGIRPLVDRRRAPGNSRFESSELEVTGGGIGI